MSIRFTKEVIADTLKNNNGFSDRTYRKSRNSEEENVYSVSNGKLLRRSIGQTSWSDSHYDKTEECDIDETRRFLRSHRALLNI